MPLVTVNVKDAETHEPITDQGVYVSIQQDKFLEGFVELAQATPSPVDGTVKFEASSLTKYRIIGDGSWYASNEKVIDTGFNFAIPVTEDLYLERRAIPTPDLNIMHYTRLVGLAQIMPVVLIAIALAAVVAGIAYVVSKTGHLIPKKKEAKQNAK